MKKPAAIDPSLSGDCICPPLAQSREVFPMTDIDREDFRNLLAEIGRTRMPFGKYGRAGVPPYGMPIYDLPVEYLFWFKERGFPKGRLGELLAIVCEVKGVGMDSLFDPLRQANGGRVTFHPPRKRVHRFPDADGGS
ncbi:DUF3820 family protein [Luteolibacter sp. Populi]|uniref:DUF3820 family protein n=1 Tax=Luteolibacter sp. Populi TaxID=3230487 RepID=UPI003467E961